MISYSRGPIWAYGSSYTSGGVWVGESNKEPVPEYLRRDGVRPGTRLGAQYHNRVLADLVDAEYHRRLLMGMPGAAVVVATNASAPLVTAPGAMLGARSFVINGTVGACALLGVGSGAAGVVSATAGVAEPYRSLRTNTPEAITYALGRSGRIGMTGGAGLVIDRGAPGSARDWRAPSLGSAGLSTTAWYTLGTAKTPSNTDGYQPWWVSSAGSGVYAAKGPGAATPLWDDGASNDNTHTGRVLAATEYYGPAVGAAETYPVLLVHRRTNPGTDPAAYTAELWSMGGDSAGDKVEAGGWSGSTDVQKLAMECPAGAQSFSAVWDVGWAAAIGGDPCMLALAYKSEGIALLALDSYPIGMWEWDGIVYVPLGNGTVLCVDTQWIDTEAAGLMPYRVTALPSPGGAAALIPQAADDETPTGNARLIDMHAHAGSLLELHHDTDAAPDLYYILARPLPPPDPRPWR